MQKHIQYKICHYNVEIKKQLFDYINDALQ